MPFHALLDSNVALTVLRSMCESIFPGKISTFRPKHIITNSLRSEVVSNTKANVYIATSYSNYEKGQ